jgi:hypothetical protein
MTESNVVRVGIGVTGFREVLDRFACRLALNFDIRVVGIAMLQITCKDLDDLGRVVERRNLQEFAF